MSNIIENFDYKVHVSTDYNIFKNIRSNRLLKQRNINALIESMAQQQLIVPIICTYKEDGTLLVIDGQHRLYVCEFLNLPVYYIVVPGYGISEIQRANQVGINWKVDDFVHMFIEEGNADYITLQELYTEYNISITTLLKIISYYKNEKTTEITNTLRQGTFEINDVYMQVLDFLHELEMFNDFEFSRTSSFVKAFFIFYTYENYDSLRMREQVSRLSYKLERRSNERDYLSLLCNDIFTFQSKSCDFRYDKTNNKFYNFK